MSTERNIDRGFKLLGLVYAVVGRWRAWRAKRATAAAARTERELAGVLELANRCEHRFEGTGLRCRLPRRHRGGHLPERARSPVLP